MPIRYRSEIKGDYLHVVVEGSLTSADEMIGYIEGIHVELVQAGLCKVLADETRCHVHMNLEELGNALRKIQEPEVLKAHGRRSAVVSSSINYMLFQHILGPVEGIKVFTDEQAARQWLDEE